MAITPDEIRNKTFSIHRRGYDQGEVHRYLASIADDLSSFNANIAAQDEIIVAEVVSGTDVSTDFDDDITAQPEDVAEEVISEPPPAPDPEMQMAPVAATATAPMSSDEFDRVGNEISLMLRQAQESAMKIRSDAEVEARSLVDQIRVDIEADRVAHEQAASELINRTEERAAEVRSEAEDYANKTRTDADEYSTTQRGNVETEKAELMAAVEADRTLAADKLAAASDDAETTLADARRKADEIVKQAQADAKAQSDEMLSTARSTLGALVDAESFSRNNLEQARDNIEAALRQLKLTAVEDSALKASS